MSVSPSRPYAQRPQEQRETAELLIGQRRGCIDELADVVLCARGAEVPAGADQVWMIGGTGLT